MSEEKENIKYRILEMALKRFQYYGYNKTTVEEIAEDAGIGKGSIYLHFKSKKEIFFNLVTIHFQKKLEECEKVYSSNLSIRERIFNLIKVRFLDFYQDWSTKPHGYEIGEVITNLNDEFISLTKPFRDKMENILVKLIEEGNENGLFDVSDPLKIAKSINYSFHIFLPSGVKFCSSVNEALEYGKTIIDLFYKGMLKH